MSSTMLRCVAEVIIPDVSGDRNVFTLKIKLANTSFVTSGKKNSKSRRNFPESLKLQQYCCENIKCRMVDTDITNPPTVFFSSS
jgi:hypothetical protein